ncbi:tetratricopeptide repeat protein [Mangrovimonas cancribranchiae]|uniref:Tetratricopeptide repeat protein n=1 Tax=Mangrovimonas cancribranchiae TaxID=3080055 RepID=A0AAU6NWF3_9FLAO
MKQHIYILLLVLGIFFPITVSAQVDFNKTPDDDLGNVEDEFQQHFFEALKQKGIENYDRAVEALKKCLNIKSDVAVVYYELGKNYNKLKNFGAAEDALKEAVSMDEDNEWYLDELYDVYIQQEDFKRAIKTVEQLVEYHPDYKEDLAALYVRTENYKDALKLLDELDETYGVSPSRDILRNQVYKATGKKKDQIENLEERVEDNPDEESNYLALIFRYSENNQKEEAFETAKKLLEIKPNSELVHLALYKFYLEDGEAEKAITSMKVVLKSLQIKPQAKAMVLTDFVKFVKDHPEYETDLVEATTLAQEDDPKSYQEVAQYFLQKGNKEKALEYFQKALNLEGNNFGVLRNILLLQLDLEQYDDVVSKSENALIMYPSQPIFYLINGVALNKQDKSHQAIDVLTMGLDYIIEDDKMLSDFYVQLSIAHTKLNHASKGKMYRERAQKLKPTN